MLKVVVNSTPIIALYKIGLLDLLRAHYSEIYLPEAVFREVSAKNDGLKNAIEENTS